MVGRVGLGVGEGFGVEGEVSVLLAERRIDFSDRVIGESTVLFGFAVLPSVCEGQRGLRPSRW